MSVADTVRETVLLDQEAVERTLSRIAHEIIEGNPELDKVALVGIHTRGVPLAQRLRRRIADFTGREVVLGQLDITFYRDDLTKIAHAPIVKATQAMPEVGGKTVVLVDDVLYTGRTVRAALDALTDHGRPRAVRLAVIIDRGHRELPIRPDHVGKNLPTSREEIVHVRLVETDGADEVVITRREDADGAESEPG